MAGPNVVHIAAEHTDLAQAGGLGDVLAGLPAAQARAGARVTVLLPGYTAARERLPGASVESGPTIPMPWGPVSFTVRRRPLAGVEVVLLCEPALFDRAHIYGPPGTGYSDNPVRYAAFSRAAVSWLDASGAGPVDAVHCHDWHAGLACAHLATRPPPRPRVVFTVHNVTYRGSFPAAALELTGLPASLLRFDGILQDGAIDCLKAGVQLADVVTTVSPTYARELLTEPGGRDLAPVFRWRRDDLYGIVNGVRTDVPPADPVTRPARRVALCERLGLRSDCATLFALVGRLTPQKGVDAFLEAVETVVPDGHAALLVGTGAPALADAARALAAVLPGRFAFAEVFDPDLAAAVFAAVDVVCVPSRFEPCGIVQLRAMRHGALALVRRTGGLADTVRDVTEPGGWGVTYDDPTGPALAAAMRRAAVLHADPPAWHQAITRASAREIGWDAPAKRYLDLYATPPRSRA